MDKKNRHIANVQPLQGCLINTIPPRISSGAINIKALQAYTIRCRLLCLIWIRSFRFIKMNAVGDGILLLLPDALRNIRKNEGIDRQDYYCPPVRGSYANSGLVFMDIGHCSFLNNGTMQSTYNKYKQCIEECLRCASICNNCASSCTQDTDIQKMAKCIQLDMECAAVCYCSAQLMSMGSEKASDVCCICADMCEACANECGKHQTEHCQKCAQTCNECAEECRKMAA
jgi:Domain of Unknown Function (DUF326)